MDRKYEQKIDDELTLQFRLATNGVIVNTFAGDQPVITTGAAYF